jgi:hypothetical protein
MYELFLRSHLLGGVGILVLLWLHVSHIDMYLRICLITPASLLLIRNVAWFIYLAYRNLGSGPRGRATIKRFSQSEPGEEVLQVRIDVKKSWNPDPGQFIYLSLPSLRALRLGALESHPFMVAWPVMDERGRLKSIVLLVQACRGFTRKLQLSNLGSSALIDGPYGGCEKQALGNYDKVLLLSCGIGLAAHLNTARYLLLAHNQQTARVRRLTLVWLLETQGTSFGSIPRDLCMSDSLLDQMQWAEEFLCALDDIDSRQILTVLLFYPSDIEGATEGRETKFSPPRKRMLTLPGTLDMAWLVEREWGAEAGNMLIAGQCYPLPTSFRSHL